MTDRQKDIARAKAIEEKNKQRILKVCPQARDMSGIYCFYRVDEDGIKYAYIGQSVSVLTRLAQHLVGYKQHIDLSIRNHGLYSESNPYGYKVDVLVYSSSQNLDEWERYYIKKFVIEGYQLRNVTSGGQGSGKTDINERKPARGYRDGVAQGERNTIKKIAHLFDLHLKAVYKAEKPSKNAEKALLRFYEIIQGDNEQ